MENEINKQVFCSLLEKLDLKKRVSQKSNEKENFNEWMRIKVKSIHYANNKAMCNAYDKIEEKYAYN
jgi:hypothetical protein